MAAYTAGQRVFGENRAAELAAKAPSLPADIEWHFIGSLQTRQAKIARPHTVLLHSLDRARLANSWSSAEDFSPALVQVNIAAEPQKHGVAPEAIDELLAHSAGLGIRTVGLMAMAPLSSNPEDCRQWFRALRLLRDELQPSYLDLVELSMGMTDDFEVAIEEGATIIRVGRAIFGPPDSRR
jgi:pyridoxal phosphate enzyme (YggS family)